MDMQTIPATIRKEQIEAIGKLRGMTNLLPFRIGGQDYPAKTLIFKGFAGSHIGDHRFEGDMRFEPRPKDMTETLDSVDFADIVAMCSGSYKPTQPAESVVTDD